MDEDKDAGWWKRRYDEIYDFQFLVVQALEKIGMGNPKKRCEVITNTLWSVVGEAITEIKILRAENARLTAALEAERGHTTALLQKAEDESMRFLVNVHRPMEAENARLKEALALLGVPANAEVLDIVKIIANLAQMRGLADRQKREEGDGMTDKPKHVYYECPNCNYVISDTIKFYARYDYPCPRCNARRYSEFFVSSFKYEPPEEQPEEGPDASDR